MATKKGGWAAFPHADKAYEYTQASLKKAWPRLHAGDAEPLPKDAAALDAWIAYHAGNFEEAVKLGLAAGGSGLNAANKAQCIYANYLEEDEKKKLKLYEEVSARCDEQQAASPKDANAFYLQAYALGRYAQGISIVKALKDGIGTKVKNALETAIKLSPKHADAHTGLGSYHAEIIDKVGAMLGGLSYGAKKDTGMEMYEKSMKLNPDTAITRIEFANGLIMMYGKSKMKDAEKLYAEATQHKAADAMERLDVELAKSEVED
jgi:tetratricopeptide (TPR) repeat protein